MHALRYTALLGDMDESVSELEYVADLLDAVHVAVGSGDLPTDAAANAVFAVEMLLRSVSKDLRAECDKAFDENDSEDKPP